MSFVFDPAPQPSLPVLGSDKQFPVRRIFCVGRNYAAHAREMGNDPSREPPFFFTKPADALIGGGGTVPYPPQTDDLHFEAELVVALGRGGRDITPETALDHVWGYAVGNDLTRRDLQAVAKKMGRPWDLAKGFDHSAVIGPIAPTAQVGHLARGSITLSVAGETRQSGDLAEMIWSVPEVISYLSGFVVLAPGDLIMTGTPAGVGTLLPGETCEIQIHGLDPLQFKMGDKP